MTRLQVDVGQIKEMYQNGYSVLFMADKLGVSRIVVNRRLKELNLPRRGSSEANKLRMQRMTAEERLALSSAAHKAVRGRAKDRHFLIKRALGVQRVARQNSQEKAVQDTLREAGVPTVPALAVFKYNVDLGCPDAMIAIEVHCDWHTSARKASADAHKLQHLTTSGWFVVYVHPKSFDKRTVESIRALYVSRSSSGPSIS
jgi:very-short-patch-repair endonuclease